MLIILGISAVWLAIAATVYALLYRRFGSRIERSWTYFVGCLRRTAAKA
jgi:hypothetical protein